jgi:hypothetical protein
MIRMKKFLCSALALCLVLTLLPGAALAAGSADKTGSFTYSGTVSGTDAAAQYSYSDGDFASSSYTYSQHLARMSLCLALSAFSAPGAADKGYDAAFSGKNVTVLLKDTGFDAVDVSSYAGKPTENSIACAFGKKQLSDGSTLIAAAVRGGGYESEWAGNFNLTGKSADHDGFAVAAGSVVSMLNSYIKANSVTGTVKVWLTGYSRGAAVANLAAAKLDVSGTVKAENVYAYTFETPQNTKALSAHSAPYLNIFNIVNPLDPVTKVVMGAWGYTRYGRDMFLPASETDAGYAGFEPLVLKNFNALTGQSLTALPQAKCQCAYLDTAMDQLAKALGSDSSAATSSLLSDLRTAFLTTGVNDSEILKTIFSKAASNKNIPTAEAMKLYVDVLPLQPYQSDVIVSHYPELCLAWMNTLNGESDFGPESYRILTVTGPAEVTVTDSAGNSAESNNSSGRTTASLILGSEYAVSVKAVSDGEITCALSQYNLETGMCTVTASYTVNAKSGEIFAGTAENGGAAAYPGFELFAASGAELKASCSFTDVSAGDFYYAPVLWSVSRRISSGVSGNVFSPGTVCTRAQVVTFLWRAMGCPEPSSSAAAFSDVSGSAYYFKAVAWANERGITTGVSAGKFAPDATVTRSQFVTFLWRAAGSPAADPASFTDVPADSYYARAVSWAVAFGVTSGVGGSSFAPVQNCLRGQAVTFLCRALA